MSKHANTLAGRLPSLASRIPGAMMSSSFLPVSTIKRVHDGEGAPGVGRGLLTDVGRGLGGLSGGLAMAGIESQKHIPIESPAARAALLAASVGSGAALGHFKGRDLGEHIFPQSRSEKIKHILGIP